MADDFEAGAIEIVVVLFNDVYHLVNSCPNVNGKKKVWAKRCWLFVFALISCALVWFEDRGIEDTHEVVAAVTDSKVVKFFKGYAALALAYIARHGVVDGTVRNHESALLALALVIDFNTQDGKNQPFGATRIGCKHLEELRIAIDAHVVVLGVAGI